MLAKLPATACKAESMTGPIQVKETEIRVDRTILRWAVVEGSRVIAVFREPNRAEAYARRMNQIRRDMGI